MKDGTTADDTDVLEALASLPTMAHPTASPDGDRVAFYYDVTGRNELHVLDVESGDVERWSDGEVPRNARWPVEWDADGERVFFHLDDAGNEQNDVHAIDRDGNAEPVVTMDGQVSFQAVSPDGAYVYVTSSRDGQLNAYRHDVAAGETTKLTDYDRAVWGVELSPDGDRIAYSTNETDDFDNRDVYVADSDGANARNLEIGEVGAEANHADWGPDGERLLVADNTEDLERAGVYDLAADEVAWYGDGEHEEVPQFFLPDGERFVVSRTCDASNVPVVYDVETGEGREFDLPDGVAMFGLMGGETVLGDDRVLLRHTTPTRRPDLLAYDLSTHEYETLVEAEYGPFSPDDFADAEYFTFASDGVPETPARAVDHDPYEEFDVGALLYDPRTGSGAPDGADRVPLVVNPHGGPRYRDSKRFDLYTQFLVQRGFAVLQVNYRGSTGRGRSFVEELHDDWGGAEQGDVATGTEHVLAERDWLDADRVAVFGGSYGGYSAYWQMVQYPDLYAAGVAWIGVSDLPDMYENTMPHFRTELMEKYLGTPEENPDLYEERSPTTHADNVDAPLFLIHGVNDRRVPVSQARIFRDALDELGYDAAINRRTQTIDDALQDTLLLLAHATQGRGDVLVGPAHDRRGFDAQGLAEQLGGVEEGHDHTDGTGDGGRRGVDLLASTGDVIATGGADAPHVDEHRQARVLLPGAHRLVELIGGRHAAAGRIDVQNQTRHPAIIGGGVQFLLHLLRQAGQRTEKAIFADGGDDAFDVDLQDHAIATAGEQLLRCRLALLLEIARGRHRHQGQHDHVHQQRGAQGHGADQQQPETQAVTLTGSGRGRRFVSIHAAPPEAAG